MLEQTIEARRGAGALRVIIVGGGATGVLLASQLLNANRRARDTIHDAIHVTIVERSSCTGLGLAYGTHNPQHLLNVRASNMSAFPDRPDHFWNWVTANGYDAILGCDGAFCFVPREIYGRYLTSLLPDQENSAPAPLRILRGECIGLRAAAHGVAIALADGSSHDGDIAVLATGNEAPAVPATPYHVSPWQAPALAGIDPDDAMLILGSGLTMIDYVLSLFDARHRGPILAMSRHGLLPQVHRHAEAVPLERADVPFGGEVSQALKWLRRQVKDARAQARDWHAVLDGLRPHIQELWQSWPEPAKRRFLRHARVWWDVHRHRSAPEIDRRIKHAVATGQLAIVAGRVHAIEADADGATVRFCRRGAQRIESVRIAKVAQCIGVSVNPRDSANPLLRNALASGLVRPDPLGIGLDVAPDCAVIDRAGRPSRRVFALGPLTRGKFWEITAIPDIRVQCASLAGHIASRAWQNV